MNKKDFEENEAVEFDFFLQWQWPTHIEETLRKMLVVSLFEACEPGNVTHKHTTLLRRQIASYPESPAVVLDQLSHLNEPSLLVRIAENPMTWPVTLVRLSEHHHPEVRVAVAENANIPFAVIKKLAEDECVDVCYCLAENHTLPTRFLRQLSEHHNPYVSARANRTLVNRCPKEAKQFPLWLQQQNRKAE